MAFFMNSPFCYVADKRSIKKNSSQHKKVLYKYVHLWNSARTLANTVSDNNIKNGVEPMSDTRPLGPNDLPTFDKEVNVLANKMYIKQNEVNGYADDLQSAANLLKDLVDTLVKYKRAEGITRSVLAEIVDARQALADAHARYWVKHMQLQDIMQQYSKAGGGE
jgi:hypothetical protein